MRCWSDAIASRVLSTVFSRLVFAWRLQHSGAAEQGENFLFEQEQFQHAVHHRPQQRLLYVEGVESGQLALATAVLQQNPQLVKRAVRALMKSHRYVFENKKEVVPQMNSLPGTDARGGGAILRSSGHLAQPQRRDHTDQEWDILTEKKKAVDDVRDFSMLREAQKELRIK